MKIFSCVKQFQIIFFIFLALFLGQASLAADAIGQVVWVKGSVQATDSSNQTRSLQRRAPIYEKDTIVTSATGSGQIVFTDNSVVILKPGTNFRVDEYKYNPGSSGDNKYVAGIAKGGFRTITGLISKANPDGYEVNTPVATIGVRGTDYTIFYGARGLSVKLDRGIISVSNQAGSVELNAAKLRTYALITGLKTEPVVSSKPIPFNAPGASSTENGVTPAGKATGPAKSVSSFCVE